MPLDRCGSRGRRTPVGGLPGRLQGGQFVDHVIMAVPARLETVAGKPGMTASQHVLDPGPEQAQGRGALLPCGQVRPPDGPLAGPGGAPLSQPACQPGEVIEAGFQAGDRVPLRLDVLAEGTQLPVKPLILAELLRDEVIVRIPIESVRPFRSNPYSGSGVFVHLVARL